MNLRSYEDIQIKTEPVSFYLKRQVDPSPTSHEEFGTDVIPNKYVNLTMDVDESTISKCDIKIENVLSNGSSQALIAAKMHVCKVCGKVLSSSSSYYVHMKLHSDNKPFQCSICEAAFCRKPYLEVHMRVHTGERPFQCEHCQKRFTQKSSLNTHKRVHTGEKPYACNVCHKRFAVKSYVIAHRWSHVSDIPISCDRCQMTFTSKSAYSLHLRSHNVDKNFECTVCGRVFVKDSYLIRHHYRSHSQNLFNLAQPNLPQLPAAINCTTE